MADYISNKIGCNLQGDNGEYACNTCSHDFAIMQLGLEDDIAHLFWMVYLALRDDYHKEQRGILEANQEFFERLAKEYKTK